MADHLLEIRDLTSAFLFEGRPVPVINNVSFCIDKGEILGVVGESGSGKSVTAKNIMRLLPSPPSTVLGGEVYFDGRDLLKLTEKEMRSIRGRKIAMIFQEPMTSLNPVYTCGRQITEAIRLHQHVSKQDAFKKAEEMLRMVGMSLPEERLKEYPHELSGGMRQRVMIAMALCCGPELLIADEPTTALDPTIQAQILELIRDLQKQIGMSVLYITHDMGVVAQLCHRVVVMYAGMVMEIAGVKELYASPLHPYTRCLMKAMPRLNGDRGRLYSIEGTVPHITEMPAGCHFAPRCPFATDECNKVCPDMQDLGNGHMVRCLHADRVERSL